MRAKKGKAGSRKKDEILDYRKELIRINFNGPLCEIGNVLKVFLVF
jgi:hypothetical protein